MGWKCAFVPRQSGNWALHPRLSLEVRSKKRHPGRWRTAALAIWSTAAMRVFKLDGALGQSDVEAHTNDGPRATCVPLALDVAAPSHNGA